jgi:hypothetical protein
LNISGYIQDLTFGIKLAHNLAESIGKVSHPCGTIDESSWPLLSATNGLRMSQKIELAFGSQDFDLGKSKRE